MKKKLFILAISTLMTGCLSMDDSTVVIDDAGFAHHTKSMRSDSRGNGSFPSTRPASGHKTFVFSPRASAWAAYNKQGKLIKTGSASGGKNYCADTGRSCRTVVGKFRVYSKKGANCKSSSYPIETGGGAKMPYCMHFSGPYSIHAAYDVPRHNSSHGCIRVLPSAARWLNQDFMNVGTTVIVKPY